MAAQGVATGSHGPHVNCLQAPSWTALSKSDEEAALHHVREFLPDPCSWVAEVLPGAAENHLKQTDVQDLYLLTNEQGQLGEAAQANGLSMELKIRHMHFNPSSVSDSSCVLNQVILS